MHTEKIKIFDEYARSEGFKDWEGILDEYKDNLMNDDEFNYFMFEACDKVQKAQQDRISKSLVRTNGDHGHEKQKNLIIKGEYAIK